MPRLTVKAAAVTKPGPKGALTLSTCSARPHDCLSKNLRYFFRPGRNVADRPRSRAWSGIGPLDLSSVPCRAARVTLSRPAPRKESEPIPAASGSGDCLYDLRCLLRRQTCRKPAPYVLIFKRDSELEPFPDKSRKIEGRVYDPCGGSGGMFVQDPVHFIQLFQNLIGNAIKYRRQDKPPKIKISARANDSEWMFSRARERGDPLEMPQLFACGRTLFVPQRGALRPARAASVRCFNRDF